MNPAMQFDSKSRRVKANIFLIRGQAALVVSPICRITALFRVEPFDNPWETLHPQVQAQTLGCWGATAPLA